MVLMLTMASVSCLPVKSAHACAAAFMSRVHARATFSVVLSEIPPPPSSMRD